MLRRDEGTHDCVAAQVQRVTRLSGFREAEAIKAHRRRKSNRVQELQHSQRSFALTHGAPCQDDNGRLGSNIQYPLVVVWSDRVWRCAEAARIRGAVREQVGQAESAEPPTLSESAQFANGRVIPLCIGGGRVEADEVEPGQRRPRTCQPVAVSAVAGEVRVINQGPVFGARVVGGQGFIAGEPDRGFGETRITGITSAGTTTKTTTPIASRARLVMSLKR